MKLNYIAIIYATWNSRRRRSPATFVTPLKNLMTHLTVNVLKGKKVEIWTTLFVLNEKSKIKCIIVRKKKFIFV